MQKVVTMFNDRLDNDLMLDRSLKDYHDIFCFREFNIFTACVESQKIVKLTHNCPVTII